jgi:glycosyltransferase involved in cell wall biosynthesis
MSAARIKVLHVLGALDRGGVETWLLNLLPDLDRTGWQFDFCTLGSVRGRYAPLAESRGSRVIPCPLGPARHPAAMADFARRLYRTLRTGRYHVVHSHVHYFSAVVLAVARAAGVKVRIAHSHNTADGCSDTISRFVYRAACGTILRLSSNRRLACSVDAATVLFSGARCHVVHYGLNGSLQSTAANPRLRAQLNLPEGVPVIAHVGRFERQKNHHFLLDIALLLRACRPEVHWLLAGDGPLRSEVERRAGRLGLADRVTFGGLREDIDDLLRSAADAFVLPSLHEGLPLALLEAQAAGLRAVVSSAVSREAAAVEGAVEFVPLEAGPAVWAERLIAALEQDRLPLDAARAQLEAAGFTVARSLDRLLGIYREALARSGPPS